MLAAIEIYNKPRFAYRDECCVILLLNSWELLLKALLSKNRQSIFYHKQRGESYRTLSWRDAVIKAETYFPKSLPGLPIRRNLELLSTYRDNSVHFYIASGFGVVLYSLAQTSILNFKDLLEQAFDIDLGSEISWQLLPLGLKPPVDVLQYVSKGVNVEKKGGAAVRQFIAELARATEEVGHAGQDTGRLMTVFNVKLESTKKIDKADFVVGVEKAAEGSGPLTIVKTQDPNVTHPLRQMDIMREIGDLHGRPFTSYTFQVIAWKYDIKNKPQFCWRAAGASLVRYSRDIVAWIKGLPAKEVETAPAEYQEAQRRARLTKKGSAA